jgi:hypothetical protein
MLRGALFLQKGAGHSRILFSRIVRAGIVSLGRVGGAE